MIETLKDFVTLVGALSTAVGVLWAIRFWLRPVRVDAGVRIVFDGSGRDEMLATVVNRTKSPIYLVSVQARCIYPWRIAIARFVRHPVLKRHLWPVYRYLSTTYSMLPSTSLKLDPQQPADLKAKLSNHPLGGFGYPLMLVEVTLSTGRRFRSRPIEIPDSWLTMAMLKAMKAGQATPQSTGTQPTQSKAQSK